MKSGELASNDPHRQKWSVLTGYFRLSKTCDVAVAVDDMLVASIQMICSKTNKNWIEDTIVGVVDFWTVLEECDRVAGPAIYQVFRMTECPEERWAEPNKSGRVFDYVRQFLLDDLVANTE